MVVEGSTLCFNTGTGYTIVSRHGDGSWPRITGGLGIPNFLATKVVGPGFCFPVQSWNGKEYALNRHQYEGKPCRSPG